MKHIFIIVLVLFLAGCSNLYNSTPEFTQANDAYFKVKSLAVSARDADRESKIQDVLDGELFYANCDTFSRTIADMLVLEYDADPAEVWLVQVDIPVKGFVWEKHGGKWHRIKADRHQVVEYQGLIIDNLWGVVPMEDLGWEYQFKRKMNMADQKWESM